jgi:hypothetical protein
LLEQFYLGQITCFDLTDFSGTRGYRIAGEYVNKKFLGTFSKHNFQLTRKKFKRFGKRHVM